MTHVTFKGISTKEKIPLVTYKHKAILPVGLALPIHEAVEDHYNKHMVKGVNRWSFYTLIYVRLKW